MAESTSKFRDGIGWRAARAVVNVISSPILIPFSAFAILGFWGIDILMKLDERFVERGDVVHPLFHVVYERRGGNQGSFGHTDLYASSSDYMLKRQMTHVTREPYNIVGTFLMSKKSGEFEEGYTRVSYRVIEDHGNAQVIEVDSVARDYATWARYRATESTIEPIWSRMFGPDTVFQGMAFIGLPFAVGVCLLGRLIKMMLMRLSAWAPKSTGGQGAADKKIKGVGAL